MTTMAALLGGVPMMLGSGVGSSFASAGYAIVGGLALSQFSLSIQRRLFISPRPAAGFCCSGKKEEATVAGHADPAPAECRE